MIKTQCACVCKSLLFEKALRDTQALYMVDNGMVCRENFCYFHLVLKFVMLESCQAFKI